MTLVVQKYGGTSVADLDRIRNVAARVKRQVDRGEQIAVVVSAMAGSTNQLVGWVHGLDAADYDAAEYDQVVASGANVRSGPKKAAPQVFTLTAGSWVNISDNVRGWVKVTDETGRGGWVYGELLQPGTAEVATLD